GEGDGRKAVERAVPLASPLRRRPAAAGGRGGGWRSLARERSTARPGASGRQRAGAVGPKSTTPRAPTAPARWLTPLSLPTKASARARSAATSGRDQPATAAAPRSPAP